MTVKEQKRPWYGQHGVNNQYRRFQNAEPESAGHTGDLLNGRVVHGRSSVKVTSYVPSTSFFTTGLYIETIFVWYGSKWRSCSLLWRVIESHANGSCPSCTHANRISIGKFNSPELTVIAGNSRVVVKAR
jgi:hypothetical protein